jgi:hypothetical protein
VNPKLEVFTPPGGLVVVVDPETLIWGEGVDQATAEASYRAALLEQQLLPFRFPSRLYRVLKELQVH